MRLLVATTVLPSGLRGGGEVVSQSVIDALRGAGHEVRVIGYRRPGSSGGERPGEVLAGVRPIETADAGRLRPLAWMASALARRVPYSSAKYESRSYMRALRDELAADPAAMILDHAQTVFVARSRGPLPPLIFLAHNAEGAMYAEAAASARGLRARVDEREARRIREAEAHLAGRARQVWVLTDHDADYFRGLCPSAEVRLVPAASMIRERSERHPPLYDVALIGTWNWGPNARGLEWFAAEVVPRLSSKLTIAVAGAGAEWLEGRHPNVVTHGVVADAEDFLARARVIAVPSLAGGGIQIKTLDAVASGVPVVATAIATRGVDDWPPSVAVADDPEEFAAQLERYAGAGGADELRERALAWSEARREQLAASVAAHSATFAAAAAPRALA